MLPFILKSDLILIKMNFTGKTVLVTGGCRGIGNAILMKFVELGADVAVVDIASKEVAGSTIQKVNEFGKRCEFINADISDFTKAKQAVDEFIVSYGKIDFLINNAGINRDSVIWKMTEEQWDSVINVNLKGYFNYIHAVIPYFKAQNSGKIVNISSINGLRGKFGQSNYSAAKAGIIGLTKAIAKEMGRYSVNVNAVAPGLIETEMTKSLPEDILKTALQEVTLNRFGKPEDVANVVAFLCSDLASHITGEVIKVDGGQYI